MNKLSRRHFISMSSAAVTGAAFFPQLAESKAPIAISKSGLITGQAKKLKHDAIPDFLSSAQIMPHYSAHYRGALKGYLKADEALHSGQKIKGAAYGAIQRARVHKANSILLHELYFDGMALKKTVLNGVLKTAIEKRFGSMEKWAEDFQACAKSASGWAVLSVHTLNGKLYNIVCDQHATGLPWMSTPLIALDVYEHAYYIDYKNNKADYIGKFMNYIDWKVIAIRYEAVKV